MLTFASAAIYITAMICTHLEKSNEATKETETKTIDLSLMIVAIVGDIILALIIF